MAAVPAKRGAKPLLDKADGVAGARLLLNNIAHEMRAEAAFEFATMLALRRSFFARLSLVDGARGHGGRPKAISTTCCITRV
jgi:hypothetical protein